MEALLLIGRFTDDDDVGQLDSEQGAAANPAIALWLQSCRPVGRVAELGSLGDGMSIEFGILRVGSTITLIGEHRVTLDEECFEQLQPAFSQIQSITRIEVDMYSNARFGGKDLRVLCSELERFQTGDHARSLSSSAVTAVRELLAVARLAFETRRELTYFGE